MEQRFNWWIASLLVGSVAVVLAQDSAPSKDAVLETPGEAVSRELRVALEANDAKRASKLLRELGAIYHFPASQAEAKKLIDLAGDAARHSDPVIAAAAVTALGATGAPAAGKHVETWLRSTKPSPEQRPVVLAAVRAAGRVQVQTVIDALLKLGKSSNDLTIAGEAMLALGRFHASGKAMRKQVTTKLLGACKTASRNRKRWRVLRAPTLRALQDLTGQRLNSVAMFEDWWKIAKTQRDPFAFRPQ